MPRARQRGILAFGGHVALAFGALAIVGVLGRLSMATLTSALVRPDVGGALLIGGIAAALEARAQSGDDAEVAAPVGRALAHATGALLFVVLVIAPALRVTSRAGSVAPFGVAALGALVGLAGAALRARSIRVLGRAFVTEADAAPALTTRDVYAWVRHPSELGLVLLAIGVTVLAPTLVGAFATVVLVALVGPRIAREEARLRASLGVAYARYAARVPAIVPRVGGRVGDAQ